MTGTPFSKKPQHVCVCACACACACVSMREDVGSMHAGDVSVSAAHSCAGVWFHGRLEPAGEPLAATQPLSLSLYVSLCLSLSVSLSLCMSLYASLSLSLCMSLSLSLSL